MDAKHFRGGVFIGQFLLAASLALVGCTSTNTGAASAPTAPGANAAPSATARPDAGAAASAPEQAGPTPDALARKTAGYVKEMQADMDRQGGTSGGSGPADVNDQGGPTGAIVPNTPPGPNSANPADTSATPEAGAAPPNAPPPPRSAAATPPADGTVRQSQVQWDQPAQPPPAGSGAVVQTNVPVAASAAQPVVAVTPRPAPAVAAAPRPAQNPASPAVAASSNGIPAKPAAFPQVMPESADLPGGSSGGGIGLQSSDDLERKLAQKIKDDPRDVPAQLDYQLLEFVKGRATPDMSAIAGLTAEDREIVTSILDGLGNFQSQVSADNNLLLVRKIQPLLEMADRLRSESDLSISTIQLCTKVDGYGVYKLADPHYKSGQENPVIVYTEISNFSSELDDTKQWQTKLTQQAILYTETGIPVWPEKPVAEPVVDQCRNRRHDFFVANVVRFPATLAPGHYLLKVTITDQLADRVAEATTPLDIEAP